MSVERMHIYTYHNVELCRNQQSSVVYTVK